MATIAGSVTTLTSPRVLANNKGPDSSSSPLLLKTQAMSRFAPLLSTKFNERSRVMMIGWSGGSRVMKKHLGGVVVVRAAPEGISEKVEESIKKAEEACAGGDPASGECAAAWDEVEELSAAASHARDKKKATDPLEEYCKDNPETDECRTYDN